MSSKLTPKLIKQAQALLIITGHDDDGRVIATGFIGQNTRDALRSFQRAHELKMTGELDKDTLAKMADGFYEPVRNERDPIKMVQAAMILSGFDYKGVLRATGEYDDTTRHLLPAFTARNSLRDRTFTLRVTDDDDKPADRLPAGRAETVNVTPGGDCCI